MENRIFNFSAGPASLPFEVMQQAKDEFMNWNGTGMGVMEISHRSPEYLVVAEEAEFDLRELLTIPKNYKVLFLQGGARSQFSMVPLNLLRGKTTADYLDTGIWSTLAMKEGARYCEVNLVASSREENYCTIPPESQWHVNEKAAYFHYVDNETVNGVEFKAIPPIRHAPLVSDMSSNFLTRPFDITQFGLIYAGAQKNIAPAGLTLVVVREDLIGQALPITPTMFNYEVHAKENSMYNTPPTFAWYMAGLTFKWLKKLGGLKAIARQNLEKSNLLYQAIDQNDFYINEIDPQYRSRVNVVFKLKDEKLNELFLKQADQAGLAYLKGHKLVGGMRASLYNAMPLEGVKGLVAFMHDFSRQYG